MPTLQIRLLGGWSLTADGQDRSAHFSGRLRALLALLLLHPNQPQSRPLLAAALWPESSDKQARTNLRKLILLVRAALGDCAHFLIVNAESLCWQANESCWIDNAHFERTLNMARQASGARAIELLQQAVDYYRGDLLPDCYDEWILAPREQLRDGYINALDLLCDLLEAAGRPAEGVTVARRLLQHDPIYERGHFHLMRLQALVNDRAGALQSYHRCATLLRRELGVDPSPAMEALYLQLLDHNLPLPPAQGSHAPTSPLAQATATNAHFAAEGATRFGAIPLVGRVEAWQTLQRRWQQAQRGRAHFSLIMGEAGIGKSRLAEEILLWVERQGNGAAHTRAYASDNRTLSYAPLARLLRAPLIRNGLAHLQPYWLTEIARLLPELLVERADIRPPQPMLDDWQRHHLSAALIQAHLPKDRPRLLVIDDLQWADAETLAWLPRLLEEGKEARLLVVGTVRSEEFEDYAALHALCDTLQRRGQFDEIALGPLAEEESSELAGHVVGQSGASPRDGAHLNEAQLGWLKKVTEGNPLFVIETARLLHEEQLAAQAAISPKVPKSVLAVIDARLARLSKEARALAEVAATIGRSFSLPVLAAASALDEAELVEALDELWRRRIVREGENDAYDFSHDRIRDGAYGSISNLRRRHLHKRAAAALIATTRNAHHGVAKQNSTHHGSAHHGVAQNNSTHHGSAHHGAAQNNSKHNDSMLDAIRGQLGYHYEQANERAAAIEHYLAAAAVAAGQYAHPEALHFVERVLALAEPDAIGTRFDALLQRDYTLEVSASVTQWQENTEQMRALVAQTEGASAGQSPAEAQAHLRRRAIVAERAAYSITRHVDPQRSLALAKEAVHYANLTGDDDLQARCHHIAALRYWDVADFDAAIPHLERCIVLARQVGNWALLAHGLELRAQTHMFNGGSERTIRALMDESLLNYDRAGDLVGRSQILNKLAYIEFAQCTGNYEMARDYLLEAIAITQRIGANKVEINPQRNLAIVYTCMGNYAAAEVPLARAQALYDATGSLRDNEVLLNCRGFLYLSAGRLAEALDLQQRALQELTASAHGQWRVRALTALAWIHQRLRQPEEALAYAELSLEACRPMNEQRQLAYTLIVRGILFTEQGQYERARADFAEARTVLHGFEMFSRALEAEAGLAYLDFLEGELERSRLAALAILAHLETHVVDFTEDACQVLLSCQRIFAALDPAALARLRPISDHHLATRIATLDAPTQAQFWQIAEHRELRAG